MPEVATKPGTTIQAPQFDLTVLKLGTAIRWGYKGRPAYEKRNALVTAVAPLKLCIVSMEKAGRHDEKEVLNHKDITIDQVASGSIVIDVIHPV